MENIKTKIVELPTFEQLTDKEKEKVIENYYDIIVDCIGWWEFTFEDWQEKLKKELPFLDDIEIHFSGFYSQGDGASFDATINNVEFMRWLLKSEKVNHKTINKICELIEYGEIDFNPTIEKNSYANHYCHHNTRYIEINEIYFDYMDNQKLKVKYEKLINNIFDKCEAWITELYRSYCKEIYQSLSNEYEYLTSEEAIKETLISNEYTFNRETLKIDY